MDLWHLSVEECPLSLEQRAALAEHSSHEIIQEGEHIFEAGDGAQYVYLQETGIVQLHRLAQNGDQLILGFARPGEVFGVLDILSNNVRESYAQAVTNVELLKMPKPCFIAALKTSSAAALTISKQLATRSLRIERRLEQLAFKSARARLASILCELADDFGIDEAAGVAIDIDLTQTEIGYLIAASRPTVSIVLGEFENDDRAVERDQGRIIIKNRRKLEQIAQHDHPRRSVRNRRCAT